MSVGKLGPFDRFADKVNALTSKAWFFLACLLLVIIWLPSFFVVGSVDTWQLLINTPTTVVTFLLVALQQNSEERSDAALQDKLNAIAQAFIPVLDDLDEEDGARELRKAIGLEDRERSSD